VQIDSILKGIWPWGNADCLWPALACMKELLLGAIGEVSDDTFCYSILKVGIDPTEGESLIALCLHTNLKLLLANHPLLQ
jgi:hypothetical protein